MIHERKNKGERKRRMERKKKRNKKRLKSLINRKITEEDFIHKKGKKCG
jgi:hypothetical protein